MTNAPFLIGRIATPDPFVAYTNTATTAKQKV